MINEDPFAVANKSGTLERIKNAMRDRMEEESSKVAFQQFWQIGATSEFGLVSSREPCLLR